MGQIQRPNLHRSAPAGGTGSSKASTPIGLRVIKGALVPATDEDASVLRRLNLSIGQTVYAELDWMRAPHDLKRIHRLGQILVDQVSDFAHMDAHTAIKAIQSLSGAGCRMISIPAGVLADLTGQPCQSNPHDLISICEPMSLSPSTMSGAQFSILLDQLCRYVAINIWPSLSAAQIEAWTDEVTRSTP